MRKILATAAVALIASSMVFAGISGYGQLSYGYDLDTNETGFKNTTNLKIDVDYATASAEKQAEGEVYAAVKASFAIKAFAGAKGTGADDPMSEAIKEGKGFDPAVAISSVSATINGANWSVDLLGMPSRLDLAKSAIDSKTVKNELDDYGFVKDDYTKYNSYAVKYAKAPGFTVKVNDFVFGAGFYKNADGKRIAVEANTPAIQVAEGLKLQAGASYYLNEVAGGKKTVDAKGTASWSTDRGSAVGGSVSVAYAGDTFSAKVAADLGYALKVFKATSSEVVVEETAKENKFSMDAAANLTFDPVNVDVYYAFNGAEADAKKANFLSAQVKADLNSFDVPVAVTVYGKDVINAQTVGGKVEVAPVEGLKVAAGGSYGIAAKTWSADASAEYAFDVATLAGKVKLGNGDAAVATDVVLGFDVSVKTKTLIPGAELS
ncbi:MAG: hypothetical protein SPJ34_08240, partial [Candidatus Ornithospirochaeta sp.]|nr:hypothetical protein [Candidatus Ornithospirochaeta sp.]